jgi:hypothetical protein
MIILTCELTFETSHQSASGKPNTILSSIVYDDKTDRFVKVTQRVSPELVQDLNSNNPMIDINDVISLDYIECVLEDDGVEEVFEMVEEGAQDNMDIPIFCFIVKKALDFIKSYRRNRKIEKLINKI